MIELLKVRINSPDKVIWEGEAESVTSENSAGPFDILPMHTNFVSIVEKKPILVKTSQEDKKFTFDYSVVYAHANKVYIYTNL